MAKGILLKQTAKENDPEKNTQVFRHPYLSEEISL